MKKLLTLIFVTALLTSCSLKSPVAMLGFGQTPKDGDTVSVHYVGTEDDGKEFDSSRRENRSPLEFVIGAKSMIPGFEKAVREMKAWDKVKVRLEPKDAYGEEYIEKTIPLSEYKEVVTQTVPASNLIGKIEQNIPTKELANLFGADIKTGSIKKIGAATLKIISVSADGALVSIDDPAAIFYGKVLVEKMEATAPDGNVITIKTITGKDAVVDIKLKQEIISKTDKDITIKEKNRHPFANKALNFEIELLEIKSPSMEKTDSTVVK